MDSHSARPILAPGRAAEVAREAGVFPSFPFYFLFFARVLFILSAPISSFLFRFPSSFSASVLVFCARFSARGSRMCWGLFGREGRGEHGGAEGNDGGGGC